MFGGKDIENRDWHTYLRGRIAIHSSSRMTRADMDDACGFMRSWIPEFSAARFKQDAFPLGVILGTVEITDCVLNSDSPWFAGKYGLVLRDPRPLTDFVPCRGALGFWDAPELPEQVTAEQGRYTEK